VWVSARASEKRSLIGDL